MEFPEPHFEKHYVNVKSLALIDQTLGLEASSGYADH